MTDHPPVSSPEASSPRDASPFRPDLGTSVTRLAYDFRTRTGRLILPAWCCTDMSGCLRLFTAIDSNVLRIETVAGTVPDTCYTRGASGWSAQR